MLLVIFVSRFLSLGRKRRAKTRVGNERKSFRPCTLYVFPLCWEEREVRLSISLRFWEKKKIKSSSCVADLPRRLDRSVSKKQRGLYFHFFFSFLLVSYAPLHALTSAANKVLGERREQEGDSPTVISKQIFSHMGPKMLDWKGEENVLISQCCESLSWSHFFIFFLCGQDRWARHKGDPFSPPPPPPPPPVDDIPPSRACGK